MEINFTEDELIQAVDKNKSKRFFNESIWESNECGSFKIIGKLDKQYYYIIKFINTGYITKANIGQIKTGEIKDRFYRSVCGVGYVGGTKYTSGVKYRSIYNRWNTMLARCYDPNVHKRVPSYKDCIVDERWHNFQVFCEDILHMINELGVENLKGYDIDKDIKIKNNKIYSKETISIVVKKENCIESNRRNIENLIKNRLTGETYIGTKLTDNYSEEFNNQSEFARKHKLSPACINNCIKNKQSIHKGWKFEIKKGE